MLGKLELKLKSKDRVSNVIVISWSLNGSVTGKVC